jgi:beta-phosphoglucomutase family hydrolase
MPSQPDARRSLSLSNAAAVIFDMDGVLTDTAATHRSAWKAMFDDYLSVVARRTSQSHRPFDDADYLRHVDGKSRADGARSFLLSRGIHLPDGDADDAPERETVCGLANRKDVVLRRLLGVMEVKAFPSSVALVLRLQDHGVGTAVVSASRNCQAILTAAGIGDLFPVRVDGTECARLGLPGKPSPAVFLEAARRLGVDPARAVIVEDAQAGVRAGRAGNFGLVIGVDRSGQADQLVAEGADVVVADLADVAFP